MLALQSPDCLPAVGTTNFAPGNLVLQDPQFGLSISIPARIIDYFLITGCQQVANTHIDTHHSTRRRKWSFAHFTGEAGILFASLSADPNRLDRAFPRTMPANTQSANPINSQPAAVELESVAIFFQTKTIESVPAFGASITCFPTGLHTTKERLKCLIQILNNYLQNMAMNVGSRRVGSFQFLYFAKLCEFPDGSLFGFIGCSPLSKARLQGLFK
jgi:hypothetical protein